MLFHRTMRFYIISNWHRLDKKMLFQQPVTADIAPDYAAIIKNPMDFGTMRKKLSESEYKTLAQFTVYQVGYVMLREARTTFI